MTGIFIIARLGSQRLTRKHLINASGKMFIEWMIERFHWAFHQEIMAEQVSIYIVTSQKEENKEFEILLKYPYLSFFYGSDENIPLRQLECAAANNIDHIISIDGDDVLCSTEAARHVFEDLKNFSGLVKTTGLPLGMNSMGYSKDFLQLCLKQHKQKAKLETGWGKLFDGQPVHVLEMGSYSSDEKLRFTLDYAEDSAFFSNIISHFGNGIISTSDENIINYVIESQAYQANSFLNDTYWENFNNMKSKE